MTTYDNSNTGALFVNDRKTKPGQPDFTGSLVLSQDLIVFVQREISQGREPKIAIKGWQKVSGKGKKYLSLAVEEPWDAAKGQQPAQPRPTPATPATPSYDVNDDIPF